MMFCFNYLVVQRYRSTQQLKSITIIMANRSNKISKSLFSIFIMDLFDECQIFKGFNQIWYAL